MLGAQIARGRDVIFSGGYITNASIIFYKRRTVQIIKEEYGVMNGAVKFISAMAESIVKVPRFYSILNFG